MNKKILNNIPWLTKEKKEKFNFDKPYKYIAPELCCATIQPVVLIEVEGETIPYNSGVTIEELREK